MTLQGAVVYLLCCYTLATRNPWSIALSALVITAVGLGVLQGMTPRAPQGLFSLGALGTAIPFLLGGNLRVRRRAQRDLLVSTERNAQEQAAHAVVEERSRIARELHDVVAHHMSLIAIQAEAAPLRHPADAEALTSELGEIRGTALEALSETRRASGPRCPIELLE